MAESPSWHLGSVCLALLLKVLAVFIKFSRSHHAAESIAVRSESPLQKNHQRIHFKVFSVLISLRVDERHNLPECPEHKLSFLVTHCTALSKWAVEALAEALRLELAQYNIQVDPELI